MFASKKGEELIKKPGEINGLDFMIRYLEDCTVYILDYTAQVNYHLYSFFQSHLFYIINEFHFGNIKYLQAIKNIIKATNKLIK